MVAVPLLVDGQIHSHMYSAQRVGDHRLSRQEEQDTEAESRV